jgi:iron-sulfur cluster assembly protein
MGCDEKPRSGVATQPVNPVPSIKKNETLLAGPAPVDFTPEAVMAIKGFLAEQKSLGACYFRVRVVPGGCQGFQHKLCLDDEASPEDVVFVVDGVKVVMLGRQVEMLRGTRIDYGRGDAGVGFKLQNPNFEGECVKKWLPVLQQDKHLE